jgi:hypothetical protein
MRAVGTTLVYAAVVLEVAAQSAIAQDKPTRSGFGFSLGLGQGSTGVTCDGCEQFEVERLEGLTGYLRLGGYVNPKFFVGVEGTGWMKNSDGVERRIAAASVVFLGYPSQRAGFFVRSGFGVIRAVIEDPNVGLVGEGLTWQFGVGYDIYLGGPALTPFVTYVNSSQVALDVDGIASGFNINPNILQLGLAITIP